MSSVAQGQVRDNSVRVGDIVTLKYLQHQSFLSCEGILVEDVYVSSSVKFFEEHQFQIYVQRQYSATNELEDFMEKYHQDHADDEDTDNNQQDADQGWKNHLEALLKGKENEIGLNKSVMKSKTGNLLSFGDTIQLLHVKSGKFLTVRPNDLARDERENMKVTLNSDGSVMSWFKVMPRYKINREGEVINNNTEILLKVSERSNEFLHCADRPPPRGKHHEVNSSMESPTPWRMSIFQHSDELQESTLLLHGQQVYIRDPESQCLLAPIIRPLQIAVKKHKKKKAESADNVSGKEDAGQFAPVWSSSPRFRNMLTWQSSTHMSSSEFDMGQQGDATPFESKSGDGLPSALDAGGLSPTAGGAGGNLSPVASGIAAAAAATSSSTAVGRRYSNVSNVSTSSAGGAAGTARAGGGGGGGHDDHDDDDAASVSSIDEFVQENGEIILKPTTHGVEDSDAIWVVESRGITKGGTVRFRTEKVHFRHFNTGKYLSMHPVDGAVDMFALHLDDQPSEKGTLFQINQLHSNEENLINGRAVQLKHGYYGVLLERGEYHDGQKVHSCISTRSKGRALNTIVTRYEQIERRSIAAGKAGNANDEIRDIFFGHAVMYHINRFVRATHIPHFSLSEVTTIWPKIDPGDRSLFSLILTRTALFVRGYPISSFNSAADLSKMKPDKYVISQRQDMFREQGLVQAMVNMLQMLKPISDMIITDASSTSNRMPRGGFLEQGKEVLGECLNLLYDLVKGSIRNQLYIADHLLVILAHVSTDKTAAKVAQELLSSNRELQETKIGLKEITIFADRMKEVPMNSMYLQLLQTCCSCLGEGLPKNQDMVYSVVFDQYRSDILIDLHVSAEYQSGVTTLGDWGFGTTAYDLYVAPHVGHKCIRGEKLCSIGPAPLFLTWNAKLASKSPERQFGKKLVPLWDAFRAYVPSTGTSGGRGGNANRRESVALAAMDSKRSVCEFFVAQLLASAEMCLGRNYLVIHALEKMYPYEALVTILKASSAVATDDALKKSAAYLLLTLYVDRDPQAAVPLPRLTRTLSDVRESSGDELVRVQGDNCYQFALVQSIISKHLLEIRDKSFSAHSYNLMKILHKLVEFNFYGEVDKLKEIIDLLVACLRRDDSDLEHNQEHSQIFTNMMKMTIHMGAGSSSGRRNSMKRMSQIASTRSFVSDPNNSQETKSVVGAGGGGTGDDGSATYEEVGDDEDSNPIMRLPFNERMLFYIEGPVANVLMVLFVLFSLAVSLYFDISGGYTDVYFIYDWCVFAVFTTELLLHLYFFLSVHGWIKGLIPFFFDFFNLLDTFTVFVYVILFLATSSGAFGGFIKTLRALKIQRVLRLLQTRKLFRAVLMPGYEVPEDLFVWVEAERYYMTSDTTISTLVKVVQILCSIQANLEDQKLSMVMKGYMKWAENPGSTSDDATEILTEVVNTNADLCISGEEFDDIYIDLLMYNQPSLVQATLELLMIHHSSHRILVENIKKLQLISTDAGEDQYLRMRKLVTILKRDADTHEIWGALENADHRKINADMYQFLNELTESCRKARDVLAFDEIWEPLPTTQNILRNLGCFDLCMKIISLISSIEEEARFDERHVNTRNLAMLSNKLLYWFILDNPANQALAYSKLEYFIKTVDEKIDSHKIISGMFRNNITLMEAVPKKYIREFIDMICSVGRFPQYLALMSSIINVGEKNVIENQYEVIKLISSPENTKKIIQYFVPVDSASYAKKVQLMAPYLQTKDCPLEDLPSDLAYHLELMGLLSRCTVGRSGMTTIEAKVQSMFHFVDVVDAILDPNTILLGKIRLGLFLFNAMLDVETLLPAVKDAECIWKLIISTQDVFSFAKDELRMIEKNGWESPSSNRQKVEYMVVCAHVVNSYFHAYYDFTIFKHEVGQTALGVERVTIKESQANDIIRSLFLKISSLYEMLSPLLAEDHHKLLYETLVSLNNASREKIVAVVENIHESFLKAAEDYSMHDDDGQNMKSYDQFLEALDNEDVNSLAEDQIQGFIAKLEKIPWKTSQKDSFVRFEPLIERIVAHVLNSITIQVQGDDTVKYIKPATTRTDIWVLKIFRTMVENRWGMTIDERDDDGGEEQDDAVVELMKVYNEAGVTNMCLDLIAKGVDISLQSEALKLLVAMLFKEGGALEIQKTINAHLNKAGSEMFFRNTRSILQNLISWHKWNGIIILEDEEEEPELPEEIIIVRCLQLMCEGHYGPNQDILREQPNNATSINLLDDFVLYLQALDGIKCRTSTKAENAVSATILEVIQGPCEGNQDYFALNTELIETLNRKIRQAPVHDCDEGEEIELKKAAIDIFQALLEGQARKTAVYERMLSVIHIDVILVLCRGEGTRAEESEEEEEEAAEGEEEGGGAAAAAGVEGADGAPESGAAAAAKKSKPKEKPEASAADEEEPEESVELRTEALVLMQMLTDFRPSLKKELGIEDGIDGITGGNAQVACIEVVWRGELQRRFFHVPDICQNLAQSTKDTFIAEVKRGSPEDKLYGLLEASKDMYREILHQRFLADNNLAGVFSRTNQDQASWLAFYLVLAINVLFVLFYHTVDVDCDARDDDGVIAYVDQMEPFSFADDPPYTPYDELGNTTCTAVDLSYPEVSATIDILIFALIFVSFFVLLLYLVVRLPVYYQTYLEMDMGTPKAILYTAMDPLTLYYVVYLAVAVLGTQFHGALTFLLLDFITKSPTSQGVLKAVYNPRKQIFFTLFLSFIVVYIFAMYEFFFFNEGLDFADDNNGASLLNNFKFLMNKALPQGTAEDFMEGTISTYRVVYDLMFFIAISLLLNILKGITIDTFVELRKELEERLADTTEKCFICGIEKNTFNRTLDRDAFRVHTKIDQNLWSYIYFIIYIWEQDKDDDDGLETFVRKCIDNNDLFWFPMRKAIRLAEHQEKGDVHSLKFRFRKDLLTTEGSLNSKMLSFKDQLSRTIGRVEKSLEYEPEAEAAKKTRQRGGGGGAGGGIVRRNAVAVRPSGSAASGGGGGGGNEAAASGGAAGGGGGGGGGGGSPRSHESPSAAAAAQKTKERLGLSSGAASPAQPDTMSLGAFSKDGEEAAALPVDSDALGAHSTSQYSALEADKLGQMHVRVVSIVGLNILEHQLPYLTVRMSSEFDTTTFRPSLTLEKLSSFKEMDKRKLLVTRASSSDLDLSKHIRTTVERIKGGGFDTFTSSFATVKALFEEQELGTGEFPEPSLVNFNVVENATNLAHQGPLPSNNLSKYMVRVQVLYHRPSRAKSAGGGTGDTVAAAASVGEDLPKYVGGVSIPLVELLNKSASGESLEVPFSQRPLEGAAAAVGGGGGGGGATGTGNGAGGGNIVSPKSRARKSYSGGSKTPLDQICESTVVNFDEAELDDDDEFDKYQPPPNNPFCFMSLTAASSRDLLNEWSMLTAPH